ncbi:rhodanese-like domain-containing protein [Krasilnikovia sp. M28-CT-15]|uniref:rhodanese-like domain-containing protein n=1 Tax=Krasilnikovia sp. M28-CT-15 TaxID=3373540 RepID=UPI0038772780
MREIDLAAFTARHRDSAVVIDVREASEYVTGHVPGAELVPMGQLPARIAGLPRGVPVYVICASGNRSAAAADLLTRAAVDAWSVAGGTSAWQRAGHPVVQGTRATA